MATELTVGKLLDGTEGRDAIHFALCPVIAHDSLIPGQKSGYKNGYTSFDGEFLGIIDPFLTQIVNKGDKCWLFLFPNTVTGLRHVWTHPAFERKL